MTEWKEVVILGASDEDADWIRSLPGYKNEIAIHEKLAKEYSSKDKGKET